MSLQVQIEKEASAIRRASVTRSSGDLIFVLCLVVLPERSPLLQKTIVGALLLDASVFEHDDPV